MYNKRGISAIVATVMIILITVAAIGILWAAIIPMIQTNLDFSSLQGRVSVLDKGYTAYDSAQNIASVQVKRDVDEGVMDRIKITFEVNGNSHSSIVIAPESGGTKVYTFDMTGIDEPDSVSVAPIFSIGNKEKEGEITSTVDIPKSRISEVDAVVYSIGKDYTSDAIVFENFYDGSLPSGATLYQITDSPLPSESSIRLASIGTDPMFRLTGLNIDGGIYRYIIFKLRWVSGSTTFQGTTYYTAGSHGDDENYRQKYTGDLSGNWKIYVLDMWDLDQGGTDWKDNTITAIRNDWSTASGGVFDLDWMMISLDDQGYLD